MSENKEMKLDKFANISKSKPLQFHHHLNSLGSQPRAERHTKLPTAQLREARMSQVPSQDQRLDVVSV